MWLCDWLGEDLRRRGHLARVLTYGYDSKVAGSSSHAGLKEHGSILLEELKLLSDADHSSKVLDIEIHPSFELTNTKDKDRKTRPLILLGHSLGGLLIKQV